MILVSRDLNRILSLPERDPPAPDPWQIPKATTPCACRSMGRDCLTSLFGVQRAALEEMRTNLGLFGMISVGCGKSAVGLLAPLSMRRTPAVLLLPPGQVQQTVEESAWIGQHLKVPRLYVVASGAKSPVRQADVVGTDPTFELYLVPYSALSRPEATDLLDRLAPRLIIADEAHKLRHTDSSTTGRVLRYLADHDAEDLEIGCCFVCWSGTLTSKSLNDYVHLAAFSLREGSPLPLDFPTAMQWAECFDAGQDSERLVGAFAEYVKPGEDPREAFRRRLFRTAGVIASTASASENLPPSVFEILDLGIPEETQEALRVLDATWALPSVDGKPGEELTLATEIWQSRTELLCGFHYRWVWPDSISEDDRQRWTVSRAEWHREMRGRLSRSKRAGRDSPKLLEDAMRAGVIPSSEVFERWNLVNSEVPAPDTVPTWLGDSWIDRLAAFAIKRRALVWFTHDAVGQKLKKHMPVYAEAHGLVAELRTLKAPAVALSIKACGQGVDGLQRLYEQQIVCCPFSSGEGWEQLLGRLNRKGQENVVRTYILRRDAEFVASALETAKYVRKTMGQEQKLLISSGLEQLDRLALQAGREERKAS